MMYIITIQVNIIIIKIVIYITLIDKFMFYFDISVVMCIY